MKRIVNYKTFINESAGASTLTAEQIDFLNKYIRGKWKLNAGVVDVDGDFSCSNKGISDFKGIVFGKVSRYFDCSYNNLTSLEGSPKEVGGDFDCSSNNLTSLEGCPEKVNGGFYCYGNNLTSLEGGPEKVGGYFNCSFNNLISLVFGPERVGGNFNCSHNDLTSLEGCPESVNGNFNCSYNKLTSLEGAHKKLGSQFFCENNEGISTKTINLIFDKMETSKSDYKTVLKSLWREIPIGDKILLYSSDLDWIKEDEASKLAKLKKYSNIKQMI